MAYSKSTGTHLRADHQAALPALTAPLPPAAVAMERCEAEVAFARCSQRWAAARNWRRYGRTPVARPSVWRRLLGGSQADEALRRVRDGGAA